MKLSAAAIILVAALAGCDGRSGGEYTAVPLPYGYQRMAVYDTVYTLKYGLPGDFAVNAGATVAVVPGGPDGTVKADVEYEAYGATLHLTFTPVDSTTIVEVVGNRRERMALNVGDHYATVTTIDANGDNAYSSTIVVTGGKVPAPVQVLCAGPGMVISGALNFGGEAADGDSLMPILKAVAQDVEYAARRLR